MEAKAQGSTADSDDDSQINSLPGSPRHLANELVRAPTALLHVVGKLFNTLQKKPSVHASAHENSFDLQDLWTNILAINSERLNLCDGVNIFQVKENLRPAFSDQPSALLFHPDLILFEESLLEGEINKSLTDLKVFEVAVLRELSVDIMVTQRQCIAITKDLCEIINTICFSILPKVKNIFECEADLTKVKKDLEHIEDWCRGSFYSGLCHEPSPFSVALDDLAMKQILGEGKLTSLTESLNTLLLSNLKKIFVMASLHPQRVQGDITRIHVLLRNTACFYRTVLSLNESLKNLIRGIDAQGKVIHKTGFLYIFEKIMESYFSLFYQRLSDREPQTRDRCASLDSVTIPGRQSRALPTVLGENQRSRGNSTDRGMNQLSIPSYMASQVSLAEAALQGDLTPGGVPCISGFGSLGRNSADHFKLPATDVDFVHDKEASPKSVPSPRRKKPNTNNLRRMRSNLSLGSSESSSDYSKRNLSAKELPVISARSRDDASAPINESRKISSPRFSFNVDLSSLERAAAKLHQAAQNLDVDDASIPHDSSSGDSLNNKSSSPSSSSGSGSTSSE